VLDVDPFFRTPWRRGRRLVGEDGKPLRATRSSKRRFYTAYPEAPTASSWARRSSSSASTRPRSSCRRAGQAGRRGHPRLLEDLHARGPARSTSTASRSSRRSSRSRP
jgi:hypothetical protein